jgi:hypothetical protein
VTNHLIGQVRERLHREENSTRETGLWNIDSSLCLNSQSRDLEIRTLWFDCAFGSTNHVLSGDAGWCPQTNLLLSSSPAGLNMGLQAPSYLNPLKHSSAMSVHRAGKLNH